MPVSKAESISQAFGAAGQSLAVQLIAVVMGGLTRERRDEAMTRLLDDAYAQRAAAQP